MKLRWGRVLFAATGLVGAAWAAQWMLAASPTVDNQIWLDRLPRTDRDKVTYFMLLDKPDSEKIGGVQVASVWQRQMDLFTWSRKGSQTRLTFPQDGHVSTLSLKTYACEGQAPEPFTLCLDVKAPDGRKGTLYSNENFRLDSLDEASHLELPIDSNAHATGVPLQQLL